MPALTMTFKTERLVFPLRLSELTSAPENEIELYVAARHRVVCDGYSTSALNYEQVEQVVIHNYYNNNQGSSGINCACDRILSPQPESTADYENFISQKAKTYAEPTFLIEYAAPDFGYYRYGKYIKNFYYDTEDFWLTRLRTILPPSSLKQDVFLKDDPAGDEILILDFWLEEVRLNPWSYSFYVTPSLIVLPVFFASRIRIKYVKHLSLLAILLLLAII